MTFEVVLLVIAAFALVASFAVPREGPLLAAIGGYTAVLLWLIFNDLTLLLPALGVAMVCGGLAAWRILRRTLSGEDVTNCHPRHNSPKCVTTNASMVGGSLG